LLRTRSGIAGLVDTTTTRHLFFTGKGGVGKTSTACALAIGLAQAGRSVLLVSTDPASNLQEVLGQQVGTSPTHVDLVPGLSALNVDPEAAAEAYRERVIGPYRGVLPDTAVARVEEQLSGACTVEIAAFEEFTVLLADTAVTAKLRPRRVRQRPHRAHPAAAGAARGMVDVHRRRYRHLLSRPAVGDGRCAGPLHPSHGRPQ
jgi:Anion-transporting ATPase